MPVAAPLRPLTVYRLAQSILTRTQNRWVDPEKGQVQADILEALLNTRLPIDALLADPYKASGLTTISLPSRSSFYLYLRWFESHPDRGEKVITKRYGRDAWEAEHLVFDTFVQQAQHPLQYVFADHWLLDVFTVDEATRKMPTRLWLTLLIDAYTRCILGLSLLHENPCIESIQSALRHAIWFKTSHHEVGLNEEWACYGIPQQLFLDNAWAHHSHSLEYLARCLSCGGQYNSIDLVFRPPYKGRYGALVERFFGNLSAQMKEHLPGAIHSSHPKQVQNAAREACLLAADVHYFIHAAVLAHQHSPHTELNGMTPHEKWLEGLQTGLPLVPPLTTGMERLFWRLHPQPRQIAPNGVSAFGMHYWSPALADLPRLQMNGQPVPYHFRYDPADISRLALFQGSEWVGDVFSKMLRQPDGSTRSLGLWERDLAKQWAKRDGQSGRNWLQYVADIDDLTRQRQQEKRRKRKPDAPPRCVDTQTLETVLPQADDSASPYTNLLGYFMEL